MQTQSDKYEYHKQYYEKNKDKIQARMKQKIECGNCGKQISQCHILGHMRTKKCLKSDYNTIRKSFEEKINETLQFMKDEFNDS